MSILKITKQLLVAKLVVESDSRMFGKADLSFGS